MYSSSLYCFFIIFSLRSNLRARSLRQSAKRASLGSWIVVCHILGAICFLVIIIIIFLLFCKFWAKVRNYYEIRITNEGNCIIFLFLTKKAVLFSTRNVFCRMIKICYKFKRLPKKSQNRVCIATLCQSFNCSSRYDLWQS